MKAKGLNDSNRRVASSVKASMGFEGLKPSTYAQKIGERYLEGEMTGKDALTKIKAKHASKFGKQHG